jgi:hypothetical protein
MGKAWIAATVMESLGTFPLFSDGKYSLTGKAYRASTFHGDDFPHIMIAGLAGTA